MSTSSRRGNALRFPLAAYILLLLPLALLLRPASALAAATPRVHAIVNARIVTAPGQVIGRGTVVIRDGVIEAVGAGVAVPADARVWPGDSLTVYAGMIDPFVMPAEAPAGGSGRPGRPGMGGGAEPSRGAAHELSSVHPEYRVVDNAPLAKDQLESLRAAGFTLADVAPRRGIVRGQSAVMSLGDQDANASVVRADAALVVSLEALREGYPGSLMGGIAVIRQAFMDAKWYRDANAAYAKKATTQRPETNESWAAMQPAISNTQPVLFLADEMLEVLRSGHIAKEAGVTARIVGSGDEYKRVADIAAFGYPLIVPVNFPDAPDVANADNAMDVSIEELRHWQQAPGNAAALQKAGVSFALTSNGLKDAKTFRANVAKAIARGLKPAEALAAVTTIPAQQLGLDKKVGTIAPGKIANLTVTRGELFSDKSKVVEVWVDGNRYQVQKDDGIKGNWTIGWGHDAHLLMVSADKDTSVKLVVGADTLTARNVAYQDDRVSFTVQRGSEAPEDFVLREKLDRVSGTLSVAGVGAHDVTGVRKPEDDKGKGKPDDKSKDELVPTPLAMGNTEAWRLSPPEQPAAVLVKNATIWTAGPQGTLEHTDLLVKAGRIAAIGKNLTAPAKAVVIDAAGKHVAPGIIDEHSHSAILGNVNECTNSVTCEVRIADVINSESINIYRQLAGGVTVMHLLHGSCNSIGGQCAVIRNKWGAAPDQLVFASAPPTVKFALGENVKQSNWGSDRTGRYPQSRAGVEETFRDAFTRAIDYRSALAEFKSGKRPLPPRRDLQLDALVEILEGKRLVHCHSYRQDEILMLMRVAEQFGFRINTFTHILEGYKVADELKAHGASALGFTDWWAYKQEVIDAIPYNGYILWSRGVNAGFNSDSDELARRLNSEAGKAIKYGGVPPDEAIKFVTLNPAKSLKIDDRVGSLEVGKDADFAIWNGPPMSALSACEQTWIEGRKYFDRAEDIAAREAYAKERGALIAKALASKKDAPGAGGGTRRWPPRYLDDTDLSGNACGDEDGHVMPFRSEAERAAQRNAEVVR